MADDQISDYLLLFHIESLHNLGRGFGENTTIEENRRGLFNFSRTL